MAQTSTIKASKLTRHGLRLTGKAPRNLVFGEDPRLEEQFVDVDFATPVRTVRFFLNHDITDGCGRIEGYYFLTLSGKMSLTLWN